MLIAPGAVRVAGDVFGVGHDGRACGGWHMQGLASVWLAQLICSYQSVARAAELQWHNAPLGAGMPAAPGAAGRWPGWVASQSCPSCSSPWLAPARLQENALSDMQPQTLLAGLHMGGNGGLGGEGGLGGGGGGLGGCGSRQPGSRLIIVSSCAYGAKARTSLLMAPDATAVCSFRDGASQTRRSLRRTG
jgi:hypothetical protein